MGSAGWGRLDALPLSADPPAVRVARDLRGGRGDDTRDPGDGGPLARSPGFVCAPGPLATAATPDGTRATRAPHARRVSSHAIRLSSNARGVAGLRGQQRRTRRVCGGLGISGAHRRARQRRFTGGRSRRPVCQPAGGRGRRARRCDRAHRRSGIHGGPTGDPRPGATTARAGCSDERDGTAEPGMARPSGVSHARARRPRGNPAGGNRALLSGRVARGTAAICLAAPFVRRRRDTGGQPWLRDPERVQAAAVGMGRARGGVSNLEALPA